MGKCEIRGNHMYCDQEDQGSETETTSITQDYSFPCDLSEANNFNLHLNFTGSASIGIKLIDGDIGQAGMLIIHNKTHSIDKTKITYERGGIPGNVLLPNGSLSDFTTALNSYDVISYYILSETQIMLSQSLNFVQT